MGPKRPRKNARKIEVSTVTPTEFELGDTAAVMQRRRGAEREQRGREEAEKQQMGEEERDEARKSETPQELHRQ